jgi:pilus assembly protein FimV
MGMALWGLFLVPGLSQALGLGDIDVRSALNQPLNAQIELVSVRPGEMEDLQVRLAPETLYRRLGIERTGVSAELSFRPETLPDGRHVIQVSTRNPVREPFINFLIEATWPAGRLVREYTLLLDPPLMFEAREAPERAPARVPPRAESTPTPTPTPAPAPEARPAEPRPAPPPPVAAEPSRTAPPADGYRVQRGDMLWDLARDLRPGTDVSVEQMMLALLRANPEAFTDDNINNLMAGYVLRVPDEAEINRLSRADASREVGRQNTLWREYRARAAGETQPQMPAPVAAEDAPPVAAAPSEEPAAAPDARLEILAAADTDSAGNLERDLSLARESAEARGREAEELRSRVAELEELLQRSERLLELKDEEMAELQSRLEGSESAASGEPVEAEGSVAADAETPPAPEAPEVQPVTEPGDAQTEAEAGEAPAAAPEATAPLASAEPEPAAAPAPAPPEPPSPASLVDDLLANPNAMMMVGGVALLVLLLIWLMVRRVARGRGAESALVTSRAPTEPRLDSAAMGSLAAAAAGGAAAGAVLSARGANEATEEHAAADEGMASDEAEAGPAMQSQAAMAAAGEQPESPALLSEEHEEITNDDTIAEVDVYLAYGLYSQAEDLLNKAVAEHPDRADYRFKLAETHFATRNTPAFEANAREMQEALAGRPSQLWERVQSMGQELNPANPMFSGAAALDLGEETETDLDLGVGDLEGSLEDMELGDDLDRPEASAEAGLSAAEPLEVESGTGEERKPEVPVEVADEDLEFDLGDLGLDTESLDVDLLEETEEVPEAVEAAGSAGDETLLEDVDRTMLSPAPGLETAGEAGLDLDKALGEDSLSGELPEGAEMVEDDTQLMAEDFSDLDFLGGGEGEAEELLMDEEESAELPSGDEVSTKLDLARAYIDMGDSDGARSTLEEVLTEGSDEQKREAQDLIDQLS